MGVWGADVFENDAACNTRDAFEAKLTHSVRPALAAEHLLAEEREFSAEFFPDDDRQLIDVILALAVLLRGQGITNHPIIHEARMIALYGRGLEERRGVSDGFRTDQKAVYGWLLSELAPSRSAAPLPTEPAHPATVPLPTAS